MTSFSDTRNRNMAAIRPTIPTGRILEPCFRAVAVTGEVSEKLVLSCFPAVAEPKAALRTRRGDSGASLWTAGLDRGQDIMALTCRKPRAQFTLKPIKNG